MFLSSWVYNRTKKTKKLVRNTSHSEENHRWCMVSLQPTLLDAHAVVYACGDHAGNVWRAIPVEDWAQAVRLADHLVEEKINDGYSLVKN